jgi:hypothetical protein
LGIVIQFETPDVDLVIGYRTENMSLIFVGYRPALDLTLFITQRVWDLGWGEGDGSPRVKMR